MSDIVLKWVVVTAALWFVFGSRPSFSALAAAAALSATGLLAQLCLQLRKRIEALEDALKAQAAQPAAPAAEPIPRTPPAIETAPAPRAAPMVEAPEPAPAPKPQIAPVNTAPRVPPVLPMPSRAPSPAAIEPPAWWGSLSALMSNNLLAVAGVTLVLIGLAFLFPALVAAGWFPPGLRLTLAFALGAGLALTGYRLRDTRAAYAQVLQGGGMAIAYLTLYVAMAYYGVISPEAGLAGFALVSGITVGLSLQQQAKLLAFLGFAGAYLAPILTVHGTDQLALVLGYALLVSVAAVGCALARRWWELVVLSFCASALVALGTYLGHPAPIGFWLQQVLLGAFTALFALAVPVYWRREPDAHAAPALLAVYALTPVMAIALQLWAAGRTAAGGMALMLAAGYFALGRALPALQDMSRLLAAACLVLGTVALVEGPAPLGMLLCAQALVLYVLGTQHPPLRVGAAAVFLLAFSLLDRHPSVLAAVVFALCSWGASWKGERDASALEGGLLAGLGLVALLNVATALLAPQGHAVVALALLGVSGLGAALAAGVHARYAWPTALRVLLAATGVFWPWCVVHEIAEPLWLEGARVVLLGVVAIAAGWGLHGRAGLLFARVRLGWLLACAVALRVLLAQHGADWPGAFHFWNLVLAGALLWGLVRVAALSRWLDPDEDLCWPEVRIGVQALAGGAAALVVLVHPVSMREVGLIEPVLPVWLAVMALIARTVSAAARPAVVPVLAGVVLTYGLLRVFGYVEQFDGRAFEMLFVAGAVQPAISLAWAGLGVALLLFGVKKRSRGFWQAGAALCVGTAAKLILFDMASVQALYRVVSFIGVGLLFVLAGYLAPLPPADADD